MPHVNPDILSWARETAGLSLTDAAEKIDLNAARGVPGDKRLAAIEAGQEEPSRPLLLRMAKQYRRPLLVFYLAARPRSGDRGQDFRTLPEAYSGTDERLLDTLLRDVIARQKLMRAALEDEDEAERLSYVGSADADAGAPPIVHRVRQALHIDLKTIREAGDPDSAFDVLRERVESLGVFVVLASNLGSHHTTLPVEVFRGFAIADPVAPFIVVNDQDSRTAWSFTLLHEFVHILLGTTGVSGGQPEPGIERLCNDVASEFLLPDRELVGAHVPNVDEPEGIEQLADWIGSFARERSLSRSLVAYRLYRREQITTHQWRQLMQTFRKQWLEGRLRGRGLERGRPDYYVVRRHRVGGALLRTTARLLRAGALTTTKAGQVLGVRAQNVGKMTAGVDSGGTGS